MQLIPAIDLLDGDVVRLLKGDFDKATRYSGDPVALAEAWRSQGAERLHVVDLNAAKGEAGINRDIVTRLARVAGISVQCAGGVRCAEDADVLFGAGAARIVIGSLAVRDPGHTETLLKRFGPARIVLALDVRIEADREPEVLTHGWQQASGIALWSLLDRYVEAGLEHLLCTDVSRDGTLAGPNVALYREILARYPALCLQASGGIGNTDDVRALETAGVPVAITGRALLDGRIALERKTA